MALALALGTARTASDIEARTASADVEARTAGGDRTEAHSQARELARVDPLAGHIFLFRMMREDGRTSEAADELRKAVEADPSRRDLRAGLAATLMDARRVSEAAAVIAALRAEDHEDAIPDFLTGRLGAVAGVDLEAAEAALRRYLERPSSEGAPSHAGAQLRLGQVLERRGDRAGATAAYREALRLEPKLDDARKALKTLGP